MSLGAKVQSYYWNDPINKAVMRLWNAGIFVVSSAGNNGKDMGITVPGNNPYILTVGAATDNGTPFDMTDDRLATFSCKGPTVEGFVKPEVIVSGVAALVISNDPYASPDEVKCRIMQTAVRAHTAVMFTYSPFEQGAGLVNAYEAVNH